MPFLLMVFLVLVCLPEPEIWPKPLWTDSPLACITATWLTVFWTGLHAFFVSRRARRSLETGCLPREKVLTRYERGRMRQQIVLFVSYVLALLVLGWGWAASQIWRANNASLPGAELLILSPFVAAQLLAWAVYYDAERSVCCFQSPVFLELQPDASNLQQRAPKTDNRNPTSNFGSRTSYVLFQLRQKLALVFLPVLLLLVQRGIQRLFPQDWQDWQKIVNGLGIVAVLIVFAAMPWIVRLVLGLSPLPPGPLRWRLEATARRLHFRCSNILVWNTRHGMANAMVIGIVPWLRYIVFTDRLLGDFTPEEVEAVFGHEVGHIRHHHMLYYFGFLTASVLVLCWLITDVAVSYIGPLPLPLNNATSDFVSAVSLVAVLLGYIFMVFGFLSRRCERQADVFGCRTVSCTSSKCHGHEDGFDFALHGQGLCPTGINTFIRALEKVAAVNGISRDRPGFLQSWQHGSIGRRIEFLQQMLLDPDIERRFQRRVFLFKALLLLILGGAVAFILFHEVKPLPETISAKQIKHG